MEDTTPGEAVELEFGRLELVHDPGVGRQHTFVGAAAGAGLFQTLLGLAHLAEAEPLGEWVLRGEPAPVFTRAGFGELQQPALWRGGQLLFSDLFGNRRGGVDGVRREQEFRNVTVFLRQLRPRQAGPLNVIWGNGPAALSASSGVARRRGSISGRRV